MQLFRSISFTPFARGIQSFAFLKEKKETNIMLRHFGAFQQESCESILTRLPTDIAILDQQSADSSEILRIVIHSEAR